MVRLFYCNRESFTTSTEPLPAGLNPVSQKFVDSRFIVSLLEGVLEPLLIRASRRYH